MSLSRRSFLGAILAAAAAPAVVRAGSLMRVNPAILTPALSLCDGSQFSLRVREFDTLDNYPWPEAGIPRKSERFILCSPGAAALFSKAIAKEASRQPMPFLGLAPSSGKAMALLQRQAENAHKVAADNRRRLLESLRSS